MDTMTGVGLVSLVMGGLFSILGLLIRTGLFQGNVAKQYRDPSVPDSQRNAFFAQIPGGLGLVAMGVFVLLKDTPLWGLVLMLIAFWVASWIFAFVVMLRPPWWMKPRWLREAEADGWQHYTPPPFRIAREAVLVAAIVLVFGGAFLFMLTHAAPFELAGSLVVGLGVAMAFVVRRRRK
jgi:hypothetical protein